MPPNPRRPLHALLGAVWTRRLAGWKKDTPPKSLTKFYPETNFWQER
jgi:hypothetical protein